MEELIEKYIDKFGGLPWELKSLTDTELEKILKKALKTGKPYKAKEIPKDEVW